MVTLHCLTIALIGMTTLRIYPKLTSECTTQIGRNFYLCKMKIQLLSPPTSNKFCINNFY